MLFFYFCSFFKEIFLTLELFVINNSCIECGFQGKEYSFCVIVIACVHLDFDYRDIRICL